MNKAAEIIKEALDRIEHKNKNVCTKDCEYFKFPHLDTACVLSSVFSVLQNKMCYNFKPK